jgi:hypothetical protein
MNEAYTRQKVGDTGISRNGIAIWTFMNTLNLLQAKLTIHRMDKDYITCMNRLEKIQQSIMREIDSPIHLTLANDLIDLSPAFIALYAYSEVASMCLYNPGIWQIDCASIVVSKEMSEERVEKTLTKRISAYSNIRFDLDSILLHPLDHQSMIEG